MQSFHLHLPYCHHATGSAQNYLDTAIAQGVQSIGFSDHAPVAAPYRPNDHYQMNMQRYPDYVAEVMELKNRSPIPVYLGLEADAFPSYHEFFKREVLPLAPLDYVIGSIHCLEVDGHTIGLRQIENAQGLHVYMQTLLWALSNPTYLFIGHPDRVIRSSYMARNEIHMRSAWREVAQCAAELGKPLEFNTAPQGSVGWAISTILWEEVAAAGAKAVISSDAHSPERLTDGFAKARTYLEHLGVAIVEPLDLLSTYETPK